MILEARNLSYAYKSQKSKQILEHVSLIFEERKFYTIVGESGAGKTTFLSLLAGLDSPTEGDILYNGENIQKRGLNYHRKHHVSLVFQNYNLIDYLTAKENVILGGRKNPEELLEKVNIPKEDWNRSVLQLSGGQQQRVAIARALASGGHTAGYVPVFAVGAGSKLFVGKMDNTEIPKRIAKAGGYK